MRFNVTHLLTYHALQYDVAPLTMCVPLWYVFSTQKDALRIYDCRFLSNRRTKDMLASVIQKVRLQNFSPVLQATACHIPKRLKPRSGNKYTSTRLMKFRCVPGSRVRSVVAAKTMEVGALGPAVSSYTRVHQSGCWWSSNTGATSWRLPPPHRSGSENGL